MEPEFPGSMPIYTHLKKTKNWQTDWPTDWLTDGWVKNIKPPATSWMGLPVYQVIISFLIQFLLGMVVKKVYI